MFLRFAVLEGYQAEVLEQTFVEGFSGGQAVREVTIRVKGEGAFGRLKFESGVHRVQRVPVTETKGRTHTSTMAVVVRLPFLRLSLFLSSNTKPDLSRFS